jgi:hypothetical protein
MGISLINERVKRITDQIFDAVCDSKFTPGQTLTVLNKARAVIDQQIADLQEMIERTTGKGSG